MHPAPSVIIFSTLSGAGFGMLFFLGIGMPVVSGGIAFGFYLIAYVLAVGGLLASVFHLGNRKNAWKSFSQWRTSWLSREAWFAVSALLIMGGHGFLQTFFDTTIFTLGWLGAGLSLATVFSTAMIYAQLKTIPRWNQPATPLVFVLASLAGGAMLANNPRLSMGLMVLLALAVIWHWWEGDRRFAASGSTINTATGLKGRVTLWERPHTGESYLTREMVYQVARKHAVKLRLIALMLMSPLPIALVLIFGPHHLPVAFAVLSHLTGLFVQRWLFFAEAEHVVGLYYGAHGGAPSSETEIAR